MKISLFSAGLNSAEYSDENNIIQFNNNINDIGYYGVLFVYHSKANDYLLPIVRYLNKSHRFKYIIAMRTYAISPEYCNMIVNSFHKIAPGRLALNIVAGDLHSDETVLDDIVDISESINTTKKRTEYTKRWLNKFIKLLNRNNLSYLVISGYSEESTESASLYADAQLCMLSTYLHEMNSLIKTKDKMVSTGIMFAGNCSEEELNELTKIKEKNTMMYDSSIIGTEQEIIDKIKELGKTGINNFMIFPLIRSQETLMHNMAKKLIYELKNEGEWG